MISLQVLTKKKQNTRRVYQDSRCFDVFNYLMPLMDVFLSKGMSNIYY